MSELPPGWARSSLGELGHYWNGRGFKKSEWRDAGRPIIRIQNLTGTGNSFNHFEGELDERHIARRGDILISWAATLGVFVWQGPEAAVNQHIFKLESFVDLQFHRYLVEHVLDDLKAKTHGSGMVHITRKRFDETPVLLPPLNEQRRIVQAIETHLSHLDAGANALERAGRNIERMRAAVLKAAVEGTLVPQDPRDESAEDLVARILEERRAAWEREQLAMFEAKGKVPTGDGWKSKYREPQSVEINTDLPSLPPTWVWATLDAIASVVGGVTKDAKREAEDGNIEVPYLRVANVQRGYLDLDDIRTIRVLPAKATELALEDGDVLFTEGGDRDKLGRGWVWEGQVPNCIHQNHVFRARLFSIAELAPQFVSHHGNTFGQAWFDRGGKQTTNLASVSKTKLLAFPVPIPPANEQLRILAEIDRQLSILDAATITTALAGRRATHLRRALLAAAFTGRLVPQDPADEPASVLLDRIHSERERASA